MGSIKKHVKEMTKNEQDYLLELLKGVEKWSISVHLRERIEQRGGSEDLIDLTIKYGYLIEYHKKDGKSRVLMRGTVPILNYVPCIVYQLIDKKIITIYWNHRDDKHYTLREENYTGNINIIDLVEKEKNGVFI